MRHLNFGTVSSSRNHWGETRYRPASSRSTGSKSEQLPLSSCCICPASGLRNLIENGTAIQFIIWYFPANVYRCRNGIKFSSFSILFTDSKTSWLEIGVMIVRADFFSVPTLMARIQSWRKAHFIMTSEWRPLYLWGKYYSGSHRVALPTVNNVIRLFMFLSFVCSLFNNGHAVSSTYVVICNEARFYYLALGFWFTLLFPRLISLFVLRNY